MVDCRKRSRMAREIGNGLGIFFNAMDGGLHGSRLVISLHLIGVVVEFASLLRASRRLNTVVEKGKCFWESRILKIAFLPIARGSKWMARDSLRMDVEEPVYARKYREMSWERISSHWVLLCFGEESGDRCNTILGHLIYSLCARRSHFCQFAMANETPE